MGAQLSIVGIEPEPQAADFETFWLCWAGKRQEKKVCALQWGYMLADQQVAAIEGALRWRRIWLSKDWEYLPAPKAWLHGERWEDELPRGSAPSSSAQVEFAPEEPRGALSKEAKAAIAKIAAQQRGRQ